ncbi:hypothetical protein ASC87_27270 [Rhizobacter sp. Root1221]|nr:hypothetical protein ASC87_27270 [Rhizobacter sp. Root1221]
MLFGGDQDDQLTGSDGSDTLDGGAGNDTLDGGTGNDVFRFGRGSGSDTITGSDSTAGKIDVLELGADVKPTDLVLTRSYDHLTLWIKGTTDHLYVTNFYTTAATNRFDQIRFADGTTWDYAAMLARTVPASSTDAQPLAAPQAATLNQLVFRKVGNALEIQGVGTSHSSTLTNWFGSGTAHVDGLGATGSTLLDAAPADVAFASTLGGTDQTTRLVHDGLGQVIGEIDAEGYLTEHLYDAAGNRTTTIRYSQPVAPFGREAQSMAELRPVSDPKARVTTALYDALNRVVQQTNAEGTVTQFTYDTVGNLVKTSRAAGTAEVRTVNTRYDLQGRVTGELTAEGSALLGATLTQPQLDALWAQHGLTHTYDAAGRRTSTTDPNGFKTLFYYDTDGRLTHSVNALGEVEERRYDTLNQLQATLRLGTRIATTGLTGGAAADIATALAGQYDSTRDSVTAFTYTTRGQVASTTGALGHAVTQRYDAFGETSSTTTLLENGESVTQAATRDHRGQVTSTVTDEGGIAATTRTQYDAFGRVIRTVDANGNTRQQSYDGLGRSVVTIDPTNSIRRSSYDAFDRVLTQTDALGQVTRYTYSDTDRSITATTPEGASVTTSHNRHGQTASVTDGRGAVTTYSYDLDGNLTGADGPLGNTVRHAYDRANRLVETTDANGVTTTVTYDAANRVLTRQVDPLGLNLTSTFAYDAKGQQYRSTDARGTVTTIAYDLAGRVLTQVVDPDGLHLETRYGYDSRGNTVSVTDPSGAVSTFTYDHLGRRTGERIDPTGLNLTRSYTYDKAGNVVSRTDANGAVTRFTYDANDRLVFTVDPTGAVSRAEYDAEGRLVRDTRYAQPIDLAGLGVSARTSDIGSRLVPRPGQDAVEVRRYTQDGRLHYTVDGTGAVVEFKYDANGNVVERIGYAKAINLATWTGNTDPTVVADTARDQHVRTTYDALNRATHVADGMGGVTGYTYDTHGNLIRQTHYATAVAANAAPSSVTASAGDQVTRFSHDTLGRPTWTVDASGAVTHSEYDTNGNAVRVTRFAARIPAGTAPEAVVANATLDRVDTVQFDRANRAVYATDAAGYVTTTAYDAEGRVTSTTRFANRPAAPGALPAADAADQTRQFVYDPAGRVTSAVDALGQTEHFTYDGNGNKLTYQDKSGNTWTYGYDAANRLVSEASPDVDYTTVVQDVHTTSRGSLVTRRTYDGLGNVITRTDATGAVTRHAYDANGRTILTVDPMGAVTQSDYDIGGRLLRTIRPAQPISLAGLPQAIRPSDVLGRLVASPGKDVVDVRRYDRDGRLRFTVDGNGAVVEFRYDTHGNVTERIGYASAVAVPAGGTSADPAPVANASRDQRVRTTYDGLNRATFVADGMGSVSRNEYDAFGNVVRQTQYATAITSAASPDSVEPAATDRVTRSTYDSLGRPTWTADASGAVTRLEYDRNGNVVRQTRFATLVTAGAPPEAAQADATRDRVTTVLFDRANRAVQTTDATGHVTTTAYDPAGRVTFTTKFFNTPQAAGALPLAHPSDQKQQFVYDAAGRLTSTIDALAQTERYTYDANGNKLTFENKKGSVWTYTYDQGNRLIAEESPAVEFTSVARDARGDLYEIPTSSGTLVTRLTYDALGNLLSRTEAANRPAEARTTSYLYDAAGHQVQVTHPQVMVYQESLADLARNGATGLAAVSEFGRTLTTRTYYDTFGNAVINVDTAGSVSQKVYDLANRVRYDIDALGQVTEYTRDAFGDAVATTRYVQRVTPASVPAGSPTQGAAIATLQSWFSQYGSPQDRRLESEYDRLGRVIAVREPEVFTYDASTGLSGPARKVTRNTYNAFGDKVSVATLQRGTESNGTWVSTFQYHDRLGRVTDTVDALGYRTHQAYDAVGNVVSITEHATAQAADSWNLLSAGAAAVDAQRDRTVTYTYDQLNRKLSETRHQVQASNATQALSGTGAPTDLVTRFGYDQVGNLTRTTDALGNATYSYYDALGRVTAVLAPTRPGANGSPLTPLSLFRRDAHGNVLVKTDVALGATATAGEFTGVSTSTQLNTVVQGISAEDRSTLARYDSHGHAVQVTDAAGYSSYTSYNERGQVAKTWQGATSGQAVIQDGKLLADSTVFKVYQYDVLGRLTNTIDPGVATKLGTGLTTKVVSSTTVYTDGSGRHVSGQNVVDLTWATVVNPSGGSVRVEVDYLTNDSTRVIGTNETGNVYAGSGSQEKSHSQTYTASTANAGVRLTWTDSDADVEVSGIASITRLRVWQADGSGSWVLRWDGGPVQAGGWDMVAVEKSSANLIDNGTRYNAFGEVIGTDINGYNQAYYDYDNAGRLWRTNAGDGIDKIFLYDALGNQTAELRSGGIGGDNRNLRLLGSAAAASALGTLRRTDTVHDKLGRATQQLGVARDTAAVQGTLTLNQQAATASIATSVTTNYPPDGSAGWAFVGENRVNLAWPDLSALGSGDVRLYFEYQTAALAGGPVMTDESGNPYPDNRHTPVVTRSQTIVYDADRAAAGVSVAWADSGPVVASSDESGPVEFNAGGLGAVSRIVLWKKDSHGEWRLMQDSAPGTGPAVIDVAAPLDATTQVTLEIRPAGSTGGWMTFPQTALNFGDALRYSTANLAPGAYEYRVLTSAVGQPTQTASTGTFDTNTLASSTTSLTASPVARPTVEMTYDRWGNTLSKSDPRYAGWITRYTYNASNQLVSETKPDGAVTQVYHDALGRQVAVRDARGNVNSQVYDAGGNLVEEHHADTGVVRYVFNGFGDKVRTYGAEANRTTDYLYDKMGRLVETRHGTITVWNVDVNMVTSNWQAELKEFISYDQAGRKLDQTLGWTGDGTGEVTRYKYDLAGHVIETIQPGTGAFRTRSVYDVFGRKVADFDQNFRSSTWNYDTTGLLLSRTDLSGATYTFTYDNARQLISSTNGHYGANPQIVNAYDAAGQVTKITDLSLNQVTEFTYDLAGRHVREKTTQDGVVYQNNMLAYDNVGRLRHVADGRMSLDIDYDLVGNRTHIRTHVDVFNLGSTTVDSRKDTDNYFTYDQMNRQTGVGLTSTGLLQADAHLVEYDRDGNRIKDTYLGNKLEAVAATPPAYLYTDESGQAVYDNGTPLSYRILPGLNEVSENYEYDTLNRLKNVKRDGFELDRRGYDAVGRVMVTGPANLPTAYTQALNSGTAPGETIGLEARTNRYDTNGRLVRQFIYNSDHSKVVTDVHYSRYDAAGNLMSYTLTSPNEYSNYYKYSHKLFDGYKEANIHATSTKFKDGETVNSYDVNGNLVRVDDLTKEQNNRRFVNDVTGHALYSNQQGAEQRQVVVNGEVLGRYGIGIDETKQRDENGNPRFAQIAEFNLGYQPITGNYPTASVGTYQVHAGDTLRSIARQSYGDEGLWFRIAEANGLTGDNDLRVGQTVNIPSVVGSVHNNDGTFKPYDPSKITGDTTPNMPMPGKGGCGGIGMLLVIIVAVVVTVFTAGAAALAMAGALSSATTIGGIASAGLTAMAGGTAMAGALGMAAVQGISAAVAVGAAMIGAAVGSIASQGVAIGMGMQEDFNWKNVGMAAVGGAVSAMMPAGIVGAAGSTANIVVRSALSNAVTQGIGVMTGMQDKFSWRGVAASAASAYVGDQLRGTVMGSSLQGPTIDGGSIGGPGLVGMLGGGPLARLAGSTVVGMAASTAAAAMRGGKVVMAQVAIDAFGNALGESLVATTLSGEGIDVPQGADSQPDVEEDILGAFIAMNDNWSYVEPDDSSHGLGLRAHDSSGEGPTDPQSSSLLPSPAADAEKNAPVGNTGRRRISGKVAEPKDKWTNPVSELVHRDDPEKRAAINDIFAKARAQAEASPQGDQPPTAAEVEGLDGPVGREMRKYADDKSGRWSDKESGQPANGPRQYSPSRDGARTKGKVELAGEIKYEVKDGTEVRFFGENDPDGKLIVARSQTDASLKGKISKDGVETSVRIGTASELQYSRDSYKSEVGKLDVTVRSAADFGLDAKIGGGRNGGGSSAGFKAEAALLQAQGAAESRAIEYGGLEVKVKAGAGLSAVAIGGSAQYVFDYSKGRLNAGFGASAAALFGAKAQIGFEVDASKFTFKKFGADVKQSATNAYATVNGWVR